MDRSKTDLEKAIEYFKQDGSFVMKFSYKGKLYYQVSNTKLSVLCKPEKYFYTDQFYYLNNGDWYRFYTPRELISRYKACKRNKYNSTIKLERKTFNRAATKQKLVKGEDESLHKNKLAKDSNIWYYD